MHTRGCYDHIFKNYYCISEESRPHYGGCGSCVCACAVAELRAGAAWEHVILRGRALAAVVQLAGRWLRKRNIHFQDLMFLLDAIWVLDLIFLILEGLHFVALKLSRFFKKNVSPMLYFYIDLKLFSSISLILLRGCGLNFL